MQLIIIRIKESFTFTLMFYSIDDSGLHYQTVSNVVLCVCMI